MQVSVVLIQIFVVLHSTPCTTAALRGLGLGPFSVSPDRNLTEPMHPSQEGRTSTAPTSTAPTSTYPTSTAPAANAPTSNSPTPSPRPIPSHLLTSNAYSFSDLLPIWQSWYFCEYGLFAPPQNDGSCPGQTERVPPKTIFLIYDPLPSCDDGPHVRVCNSVPSDHWIIVNVVAYVAATDFVDTDLNNQYDTPESMKKRVDEQTKNYTVVVAKVDGDDIDVPRVATESISKLGVLDTSGCSSDASFVHGWSIYVDGYWLRLGPLTPGNHTIEFIAAGEPLGDCTGTKYELTVV